MVCLKTTFNLSTKFTFIFEVQIWDLNLKLKGEKKTENKNKRKRKKAYWAADHHFWPINSTQAQPAHLLPIPLLRSLSS
jgi:hypothetical protein